MKTKKSPSISQQKPHERLAKHRFSKAIFVNLRPLLKSIESLAKQSMETAKTDSKDFLHPDGPLALIKNESIDHLFTEKQNYHFEVNTYTSNILFAVERLSDIQVYLKRFPRPRTYERAGITQDKWIHYHFANYLVTVLSIYDTALILTNVVFEIGLNPVNCKKNTINRRLNQSNVKTALEILDEVTKDYRNPRNLFVHRYEAPKLRALVWLTPLTLLQRIGQSVTDIAFLDSLYETIRPEILNALDKETDKIVAALSNFFDSLEPAYLARSK